ncbi:NusG domain II-containing protein [Pseudothermotoga sp.]|uniref:NusG domain II-containing protein n=1 Tax=Pseudothermotoga sp. TaxID=2033661 RepID=UPI000E96047E|nr:NusG domain II-containing protein [Pseudothermotoga sp.]HBJ81063.1 hypothetical protein [Pseudothermotoga sp.]
MSRRNKFFRKADFLVILVILLIIIIGFFVKDKNSSQVEVWKNGEIAMVIKQAGEYELREGDNHLMNIYFDGKTVFVKNSSCSLKICEKTGKVGPGGVIICVPNRVLIKFSGKMPKADVITW